MKTIHKQILKIVDTQTINIPKGSMLLSVANQMDDVCIWYCLDTNIKEIMEMEIRIFGTGQPIPNDFDGKFIGTVLTNYGALVWHIFQN